ncbi:MAG: leucine-rich repeat protein [Erysipelotrichaceae bacterium]|nr:leucine-rich repeat protein [Erysipelotrichaceae bacterium]
MKRFLLVILSLLLLFSNIFTSRTVFAEEEQTDQSAGIDVVSEEENSSDDQEDVFLDQQDYFSEQDEANEDTQDDELVASDKNELRSSYSGICGDNATWSLNWEEGVLNIYGTGPMYDYGTNERPETPWISLNGINTNPHIYEVYIENGITRIGDNALGGLPNLRTVEIPNTVTSIGFSAFSFVLSHGYNRALTSITIPSSVKHIEYMAFANCLNLKEVCFSDLESFFSIDFDDAGANPLFNGADLVIDGEIITHVEIPEWVTDFGNCFSGCRSIKTVIIPDSVDSICESAFENCTSLESVQLPSFLATISYRAFKNCSSLKTISIPYGVKELKPEIFLGCSSLDSVILPESLEAIGSHVFTDCGSLKTITIPDSVQSIYSGVFYNCSSLESVRLPKSINGIPDTTFYNCPSLKTVNIPDSVRYFGYAAFYGCSSLETIHIPDSLYSIRDQAFYGCSSLKKFEIPDGVAGINEYSFAYCTGLTYIKIPASMKEIKNTAFTGCTGLRTAYYGGTETQWNAYGSVFPGLDVDVIFEFSGEIDAAIDIPDGQYCIHVRDHQGKSLEGVSVSWTGDGVTTLTEETDESGNAFFPLTTINEPLITASKEGYQSWSNENSNWKKNNRHFSSVVLYPESYGRLMLASAQYWASGVVHDILTETHKVNLMSDIFWDMNVNGEVFHIRCSALQPDLVDRYEFYQFNKLIKTSTDGVFSVSMEQDGIIEGGSCFIRTYGTDGTHADTKINLEFIKNEKNKKDTVSFDLSELSFKVSDDSGIPFLSGNTIKISMPVELPVKYEITEDKIQIGINVKLHDGSDDPDKTPFEEFEEKLNKTADLFADNEKMLDSLLKEYMKESKLVDGFNILSGEDWTKKTKVNFIGYAEADKGSMIAKGRIFVQIKVQLFEFKWFTIAWGFVPITVNAKFGGGLEVGDEISFDLANGTFVGGFGIKPAFDLEAFGGVAALDLAGVGAYGRAKLEFDIRLLDFGDNNGLQSATLEGEAGIKAYFGPFLKEHPFAYDKWYIYTKDSVNSSISASSLLAMESNGTMIDSIYDPAGYKTAGLEYLRFESEWQGNDLSQGKTRSFVTNDTDHTRSLQFNTYEILLNETYRNAKPVMVSDGTYLYASFVEADPDSQERFLVISKYDGTIWSEPVRVDVNSKLDSNPSLCIAANGDLLLAYSKTVGSDYEDILSYATSQMISVGIIDKESLEYTELASYENDNYVYAPELSAIGGNTYLVWLSSEIADEHDVLLPSSASIHFVSYNGLTFGDVSSHYVDSHVGSKEIGKISDDTVITYVANDGIYEWNTESDTSIVVAEDAEGKIVYDKLPSSDEASFIFYSNSSLNEIEGNSIEIEGLTNEFSIIGNTVYYSRATENGADLYMTEYDAMNDAWSPSICINEETGYLENISVCSTDGGTYLLGMNTKPQIGTESIDDHKDLVFMSISSVSDLVLDYVEYDTDILAVGEDVPLILHVTNNSDHAVNGVDIMLDNEFIINKEVSMLPGESVEIELTDIISCPGSLTSYDLYVAESEKADSHPEDNAYTVKIGYCDFELSVSYEQIGDSKSLLAYVENKGIETGSGIIRFFDVDGTQYNSFAFKDLEAGETTVVICDLESDFKGYNGGNVFVTVTALNEEQFTYNNSYTYFIPETIILVSSIDLGDTYIMLYKRDTYSFTPAISPADASRKDLVWTSSNEEIVAVDENGTITALRAGQAVIRATSTDGSGIFAECTIDVYLPTVHYMIRHYLQDLDGSYPIEPFETETILVTDEDTITPDTKEYPGFTAPEKETIQVDAAGNLVTDYYYTRNSYDLNIIVSEGVAETEGNGTYKYQQEVVLSATPAEGYKDVLWSGDSDTAIFKMPPHDVNVTVTGVPNEYQIAFDMTLGQIEIPSLTAYYSIPVQLPSVPAVTGLVFDGWALSPDGDVAFNDNELVTNLSVTDGDVVTLYAVWRYKYKTPAPYSDVKENEIEKGTVVSLYCDAFDATIYYTVDGTEPTKESSVYEDSFTISENTTIKAFASSPNRNDSDSVTITYLIKEESFGEILPEDMISLDSDNLPKGLWTSAFTFDGEDSVYYDPSVKSYVPDTFRVYHHKTRLILDIDYTVKYSNNTKAGTAAVTITGKNNYAGTYVKYFNILPMPIDPTIELVDTYAYNKSGITLSPKVSYQGKTLKNASDYVVKVEDENGEAIVKPKETGTYKVLIDGMGNYAFHCENQIRIIPSNQKLVSNLTISLPSAADYDYDYDGTEKKPLPVIKDGKTDLTDMADELFDISYSNNIDSGTGYIIIQAKDTCVDYAGSVRKTFTINGISLSKAKISGFASSLPYNFDGDHQVRQEELELTVDGIRLNNGNTDDYDVEYLNNTQIGTATLILKGKGKYYGIVNKSFKITGLSIKNVTVSGITDSVYSGKDIEQDEIVLHNGNALLVEGTDYSVSYKNNNKAGKATISFTGMGGYAGTLSSTFIINKAEILAENADLKQSYPYTKGGTKPEPVITVGDRILVCNTDYTLSYKNNSKVGEAFLTVKGKGNYSGEFTYPFTITSKDISAVTMSVPDRVYSAKANGWKSVPVLTDVDGKKLSAGTDYSKDITYVYKYDTIVQDGSSKEKEKPKVFRNEGDPVESTDILPVNTVITVTVSSIGSNYTGKLSKDYRITSYDISKATVNISTQYYTGKAVTLLKSDITVKVGKDTLAPSDYDIVSDSYVNNIEKGSASVTIRGKGNYGGTKTVKFTISQKPLGITLRFNSNGATSGNMKDLIVYKDTKLTKNAYKKIVNNKTIRFLGWNTKQDGSGDFYEDLSVFAYDPEKAGTLITLYAVWHRGYEIYNVDVSVCSVDEVLERQIRNTIENYFNSISLPGDDQFIVNFADANEDPDIQAEQIYDFISNGSDAILFYSDIMPSDRFYEISNAIFDSGITSSVVDAYGNYYLMKGDLCDDYIEDYSLTDKCYYIADLIYHLPDHGDVNNDGILKFFTIEGTWEETQGYHVSNYLPTYLSDKGMNNSLITSLYCQNDRDMVKSGIQNYLQYYPLPDFIYADSINKALGAMDGIEEYKKTWTAEWRNIHIITSEYDEELLQAIKDGGIAGTVVYDGMSQFKAACTAIQTMLKTGKICKKIGYIPYFCITEENIDQYLDQ